MKQALPYLVTTLVLAGLNATSIFAANNPAQAIQLGGTGCVAAASDYDGDRLTDPAVYQASNGAWAVLLSGDGYAPAIVYGWGAPNDRPIPADYDGDRKADPAVYAATGGCWRVWLSVGGYTEAAVSSWGDIGFDPVPQDYDKDGKIDPAVYAVATGAWRVWFSGAGYPEAMVTAHGGIGQAAVAADYDGDGFADPAVYAASNGQWRVWLSSGGYVEAKVTGWGGTNQTPVPADYDGDGWADPAVYDSASSTWRLWLSSDNYQSNQIAFGNPGDLPVPGDYNGDGAAECATYQPTTGNWTIGGLASGQTYYVATTGNDTNSGSAQSPWATPGYGSRRLQPGDTLIIRGGAYRIVEYDQDDLVPPSGTLTAWTTIRGETGNRPLIKGCQGLRAAIDIGGKRYVRIENLEITSEIDSPYSGGLGQGIEAGGSAAGAADISHVVIQDLDIHHIDQGGGINFSGDMHDVRVTGTRISHATMGGIAAPASYGRGGWKQVVISNCYLGYSGHFYGGQVHDDGPLYERPDGFGIEDSDGPVTIVATTAEHNFGDGLDSKSGNTTIERCIVANNSCDGIKLWKGAGRIVNTLVYGRGDGNTQPTDWSPIVIGSDRSGDVFEIINVTVDDEVGNSYATIIQYDHPGVALNLTIRNTIFSSRGLRAPVYLAGSVQATLDYNLFYMPAHSSILVKGTVEYTSEQVGALGSGNRYGDPLFIATGFGATGDYHLRAGSPALDTGTAVGAPANDLAGTSRPQGAGFDIGCYEQ